jgi:apoptosis-inducing factor 3
LTIWWQAAISPCEHKREVIVSETTAGLGGPDLRVGIALGTLEEGKPYAGHADGEAVVLIRRGDEVFAMGGTCTHYSGPLAEGIVTGEQIRCPWHHACFSIRTGKVIAAPALGPIPTWQVTIRDGWVSVQEKRADEVATPRTDPSHPDSVVIVGSGAAGFMAAETLRIEGYTGAITLIDREEDAPYDRPNLSKDYLAGAAPEEWMVLRGPDFFAAQSITRVTAAAESIDAANRTVRLSNGSTIGYGALLLATGARAIVPPIPGAQQPHVHVLRSFRDCKRIIASLESSRRVVIVGASFIGMEAAASLRTRGIEVTIVAPEPVPFVRILGEPLGRLLQQRHEGQGVRFYLGRTVKEIRERDVVLNDGSTIPADLVLLGVGVIPEVDLAKSAGLALDNGVIVNQFLETSVPGIFAAGDIARYPDARFGGNIRVEHWVVAERQGQFAARNMLGAREPYRSIPFFWTRQFDVPISYVGHAAGWDDIRIDGSLNDLDCTITYLRDRNVMAVATMNRDLASLEAEVSLENRS